MTLQSNSTKVVGERTCDVITPSRVAPNIVIRSDSWNGKQNAVDVMFVCHQRNISIQVYYILAQILSLLLWIYLNQKIFRAYDSFSRSLFIMFIFHLLYHVHFTCTNSEMRFALRWMEFIMPCFNEYLFFQVSWRRQSADVTRGTRQCCIIKVKWKTSKIIPGQKALLFILNIIRWQLIFTVKLNILLQLDSVGITFYEASRVLCFGDYLKNGICDQIRSLTTPRPGTRHAQTPGTARH